jgi:hypothetical protein
MKHHLGLQIILLPETNGALEPHDPRSHPKRDVHGFVFAVVAAAALTVIAAQVIVDVALTITTVVIL